MGVRAWVKVSILALVSLVAAHGQSLRGSAPAATDITEACLREGIGSVVTSRDAAYNTSRQCKNTREDILPSPIAVVQVRNVAEVQAAVRCGSRHGVYVCARAGGHGFENDAGCSGGIAIDLQDLQDLDVNESSKVVTFGAGYTLGQLYYKLKQQHNLVVPGGAESGVGASGLFLGCGRGMLTQLYGLACDTIKGIGFVDASGVLQYADATQNPDMYWLARGGGGNFPGIVTKFVVQAFDAPGVLTGKDCFYYTPEASKSLVKAWLSRLEEMSKPSHQMFTHIIFSN
jgi:FAD/FMN-containing dehydrogenase